MAHMPLNSLTAIRSTPYAASHVWFNTLVASLLVLSNTTKSLTCHFKFGTLNLLKKMIKSTGPSRF